MSSSLSYEQQKLQWDWELGDILLAYNIKRSLLTTTNPKLDLQIRKSLMPLVRDQRKHESKEIRV
jgi:hypothetical protein